MHPCQGESGYAVVKLAVHPLHNVMALFTGSWEPLMRHGTGRVVVIGLMARNASRGGQVVIVVHMAVRACSGRDRMPASQWKSHRVVIELRT